MSEPIRIELDIDQITFRFREPLHVEAGEYLFVIPLVNMPSEHRGTFQEEGTIKNIIAEVLPKTEKIEHPEIPDELWDLVAEHLEALWGDEPTASEIREECNQRLDQGWKPK